MKKNQYSEVKIWFEDCLTKLSKSNEDIQPFGWTILNDKIAGLEKNGIITHNQFIELHNKGLKVLNFN